LSRAIHARWKRERRRHEQSFLPTVQHHRGDPRRFIGKKAFEGLWGIFDHEEAPDPKHREIDLKKLIPALVLEGAIFRAVRGLFDHGSRRAFTKVTGSWPGEERPEPV
jgi:hypothetical protein